MTLIKTIYKGNLRTEIEHHDSGAKIITDAPKDNNGKGEAFSPTDLFASSLGACILTIAGMAAEAHGFSIDGATIETVKVMAANPRRVSELCLDITFPKKYSDKEMRLIDAAIKTCPVANSLHPDIIKSITLHFPND